MGRKYKQLSLEERCEIARLQAEGRSIGQIAAALDRAPSTISREVRRNRGRQVGYKASYAQEQTRARRWSGSRLEREPELRRAVLERLAKGWSPAQAAGPPAPPRAAGTVPGAPPQGLPPREGPRPPRPPSRPQGDQPREHLPLHLCPDRPHQGLPLAALYAARHEQAWLGRAQGRGRRNLDRRTDSHR